MSYQGKIKEWIEADSARMQALAAAASLNLPDWCLAAGLVRNLVWDKTHGYRTLTGLNDIDFIYFDPADDSEVRDYDLEKILASVVDLPWSVKNQARMHKRNHDNPYRSTLDAMSYWPEVETAVGAALNSFGDVILISPFGFESLFNRTVTINAKRPKPLVFNERMINKRWLKTWPKLVVNT
ncbi:MAG: nucleotidyltransferase family protein [Pseudohongiella sp.]|nr:nucleotidyltransferase family protein [Pseudohongiella sp.]